MTATANKRVLMLLENNPYPQDARVRPEARALTDAGLEVYVIAPGRQKQPWHEVLDGVHVYRYPQPRDGGGLFGYFWEYGVALTAAGLLSLLVLFRHGFDVIHAHNPPDIFVIIAGFYRLLGKRFIFDHHDIAPEMYFERFGNGNRLVYRILLFFERRSCRMADRLIVTNDSYKHLDMQRNGIPADRITVVRNGPDFVHVVRVAEDPELRAKADTIVGFVGAIGYQDGLDHLLRALKYLVADLGRRDVYCVIVGDGDAMQYLVELTRELELDDYVWFAGFRTGEALCRLLSTVDIFVAPDPANPYSDQSTMIKMMEHMYLERPTVAFDLTEHRVSAGEAAVYASDNDEHEFAQLIAELMDDPERRERMGQIGRQRIESELAWHHQARKLVAVYESLGMCVAADSPSAEANVAVELTK
ncbi:MAG: glycosyltransferase family 4 protein [Pirellulales bacterium]